MKPFNFKAAQGSVVWIEPNRLVVASRTISTNGLPTEDQLGRALMSLPAGPTKWILDDLVAPSMVVKDIVEVPKGSDAKESYFRWKFAQALAVEGNYMVQGLSLGDQGWLLVGMPRDMQEAWVNLAAKVGRPVHVMIPRWLWLYNRAASTREKPGMLLSLLKTDENLFTGSLVTWGKTLSLLRQWPDAADIRTWLSDRIEPTVAFLGRDGRTPAELLVWGLNDWPNGNIPHMVFQSDIPSREAI
jgi:hypothetical protein